MKAKFEEHMIALLTAVCAVIALWAVAFAIMHGPPPSAASDGRVTLVATEDNLADGSTVYIYRLDNGGCMYLARGGNNAVGIAVTSDRCP